MNNFIDILKGTAGVVGIIVYGFILYYGLKLMFLSIQALEKYLGS